MNQVPWNFQHSCIGNISPRTNVSMNLSKSKSFHVLQEYLMIIEKSKWSQVKARQTHKHLNGCSAS